MKYFWIGFWFVLSLILSAQLPDFWPLMFMLAAPITFLTWMIYVSVSPIERAKAREAEQKKREEEEEKRRKEEEEKRLKEEEQESIKRRAEKCGRLSELEELYRKRSYASSQLAVAVFSQPVPLMAEKKNTTSRTIGATMVGGPLYGAYVSEKAERIDKENERKFREQLERRAKSQSNINCYERELQSINRRIEKLISELPEE